MGRPSLLDRIAAELVSSRSSEAGVAPATHAEQRRATSREAAPPMSARDIFYRLQRPLPTLIKFRTCWKCLGIGSVDGAVCTMCGGSGQLLA